MEKHFYLGVGLLALLLIFGILAWVGMEAVHAPAEALLNRAAELALSGDMQTATALGRQAKSRWEQYRSVTASLADHAPMDDVEKLFAEMEVYAAAGESAHFASCCLQLSNMEKAMYDAHSLTGWNLL